jgi:hypothetical protein
MIRMPHRSVTRFFIPLLDVMILLFCIFLLLPVFKEVRPGEGGETSPTEEAAELRSDKDRLERERQRLGRQVLDLEQQLRQLRAKQPDLAKELAELERLRKEKIKTLQSRLVIRVLDIDPDTGKLYFYDPTKIDEPRLEITGPATAQRLIETHRREAGDRELYYLFRVVYPRRVTGFPQRRQIREYERWFADVAHGFGSPTGG